MVKLREEGRESDRKLQGKRDDNEIETTRSAAPMSFGSRTRTRTRSVMTASMSNENEIDNDGADQLWVKNENENDDADDLDETISAA